MKKSKKVSPKINLDDIYNLDIAFYKWIVPRLTAFRDKGAGWPGNLNEKKWNKILTQMIDGFEIGYFSPLRDKENIKKLSKAHKLFKNWCGNLWV